MGSAPLADFLDCSVETLRGDARFLQCLAGIALRCQRDCQQQPLHGHEAVARLGCNLFGLVQQPRRILIPARLAGPGYTRKLG